MIKGKPVKRPRYLAYDLVHLEGQDFRGLPYGRRLGALQQQVIGSRDEKRAKFKVQLTEPFSLRYKPFKQLTSDGFRWMQTYMKDKTKVRHASMRRQCMTHPCMLSGHSSRFLRLLTARHAPCDMLRFWGGFLARADSGLIGACNPML